MNRLLPLSAITLLVACAPRPQAPATTTARAPQSPAGPPSALRDSVIAAAEIRPQAFNPSRAESSGVRFALRRKGRVSIRILDEDGFPVRTLWKDSACEGGIPLHAAWNGRDDSGRVLPDEAYFPVLTWRDGGAVDSLHPLLTSGGLEFETKEFKYQPGEGQFSYRLDEPSRVQARVGFAKGAMLATPVDWKPRPAGLITDSWNGRDADNLADISRLPGLKLALTGYTLPEPCFLLYGNPAEDYRAYRSARDSSLAKRVSPRSFFRGKRRVSPHFFEPRLRDAAPRISVAFPEQPPKDSAGAVLIGSKVLVRVELDPRDAYILEEQFEVSFFLDNEFYAEEEVGYAPYNWLWKTDDVKPGRHVLTVNLASFKDRVGVKSVVIRKE